MVYCVQLQAAFSNATRRNAVLADIETWIAGKPRWSAEILEAAVFRFGANGIRAELRFTTRTDMTDLKTQVETFATGVRTPLPESWIRVHDCTHDEATNVCALVAETVW